MPARAWVVRWRVPEKCRTRKSRLFPARYDPRKHCLRRPFLIRHFGITGDISSARARCQSHRRINRSRRSALRSRRSPLCPPQVLPFADMRIRRAALLANRPEIWGRDEWNRFRTREAVLTPPRRARCCLSMAEFWLRCVLCCNARRHNREFQRRHCRGFVSRNPQCVRFVYSIGKCSRQNVPMSLLRHFDEHK